MRLLKSLLGVVMFGAFILMVIGQPVIAMDNERTAQADMQPIAVVTPPESLQPNNEANMVKRRWGDIPHSYCSTAQMQDLTENDVGKDFQEQKAKDG